VAPIRDSDKILEHLKKHGYITFRDAEKITPYGYLGTSISWLRRKGYRIVTTHEDMDGNKVTYVVYKLIESEEKDA